MKTMISIMKINGYRMMARKNYILTSLAITLITLFLAVYMTSKFEVRGNIAVISPSGVNPIAQEAIHSHLLDQAPPRSQLVRGKFDAVVTFSNEGQYAIDTLKGEEFQSLLRLAIDHPEQPLPNEGRRGVGTNIVGFLLMFILLEGLLFMNLFTEDKEKGLFRRTVISPAGIANYLLAHSLFCFMLIYVPTLLLFGIMKGLLHMELGFTLAQYAGLLIFPAMLSTAFAVFMLAWIEKLDNAMSLASTIVLLTSLLSGTFFRLATEPGWLKGVTELFPQKQLLYGVQGLEQSESFWTYAGSWSYVVLLALLMFGIGWWICARRFRQGHYG